LIIGPKSSGKSTTAKSHVKFWETQGCQVEIRDDLTPIEAIRFASDPPSGGTVYILVAQGNIEDISENKLTTLFHSVFYAKVKKIEYEIVLKKKILVLIE
jgi:hypothetical protein